MGASLGLFLALCVVSRIGYSINDIWTGRLARKYSPAEVAMWRGLTLGITMLPFLFFVSPRGWQALPAQTGTLLLSGVYFALSVWSEMRAAPLMPFGLRAVFMMGGASVGGMLLGIFLFQEHLSALTLGFCALLISSSCLLAFGDHATEELHAPRVRWGIALCLVHAGLNVLGSFYFIQVVRATDPLLAGYCGEVVVGLSCLPLLLFDPPRKNGPPWWKRAWQVGVASSPTAIATAAWCVAVTFGPVSIAIASCGLQVVFISLMGFWWHREKLGPWRWTCITLVVAALAGLGWSMQAGH